VLAYDDQFLLGNGPRTGELLERLISDLHDQPQPGDDPDERTRP
jgi:ABC-type hemin transport system substrate-binding protein